MATTRTFAAAAVLILASSLSGCGGSETNNTEPSASPTASASQTPTPSESTSPSASPTPAAEADVAPGQVKGLRVGMTKAEWTKTGLIGRDKQREAACEGTYWTWRDKAMAKSSDLVIDDMGTIAAIGVTGKDLSTEKGIHVGSTYAELTKAYGAQLAPISHNDYGSAMTSIKQGQDWLGFAFDVEDAKPTPTSKIVMMEVTHGQKPWLLRDGC